MHGRDGRADNDSQHDRAPLPPQHQQTTSSTGQANRVLNLDVVGQQLLMDHLLNDPAIWCGENITAEQGQDRRSKLEGLLGAISLWQQSFLQSGGQQKPQMTPQIAAALTATVAPDAPANAKAQADQRKAVEKHQKILVYNEQLKAAGVNPCPATLPAVTTGSATSSHTTGPPPVQPALQTTPQDLAARFRQGATFVPGSAQAASENPRGENSGEHHSP